MNLTKVRAILRYSKNFSTAVPVVDQKTEQAKFTCLRCSEANPANHTEKDLTAFYTIPANQCHIFQHGGLPKSFFENCTTFNETAFMIRKDALDIIELMKCADYSTPPLKYVLYGRPGVGKSLIMGHVLHYASVSQWLLVHIPWVGNWLRSPKKVTSSTKRPKCVDLPENAIKWLLHFKIQNSDLIKSLDLRLENDYEWSAREISKAGDSLLNMVDIGINRPIHASEVIIAVVTEVKQLTKKEKCKTLVAIDGFNAFFHPQTKILNEERMVVPPERVSFIPAFLDITRSDWHNSAIIVTCDELVVPGHDRSALPLYQLGKTGFEHLDPFIPIHVNLMANNEMSSLLAYYKERRWLQNTTGDNELIFLCGGNPYSLMKLCAPL